MGLAQKPYPDLLQQKFELSFLKDTVKAGTCGNHSNNEKEQKNVIM